MDAPSATVRERGERNSRGDHATGRDGVRSSACERRRSTCCGSVIFSKRRPSASDPIVAPLRVERQGYTSFARGGSVLGGASPPARVRVAIVPPFRVFDDTKTTLRRLSKSVGGSGPSCPANTPFGGGRGRPGFPSTPFVRPPSIPMTDRERPVASPFPALRSQRTPNCLGLALIRHKGD